MQFGVVLDSQFGSRLDVGRRIDEMVRLTEAARDSGYQSVFAVHHYLSSNVTLQPLPTLARLVPHTGTMRLGTGVYLATVEHPVSLAENAATLDQLSQGRLVLGLGAGYRREEFDAMGVERSTRWERLAETVDVMTALWSGDVVDHEGDHFSLSGRRISVPPVQQPRPPIWVGANGPKTVLRAAAIGDAWIVPPNVKARWAIGNLAAFRDERARLGRPAPAEHPIMRELFVGDTDAQAEAEAVDFVRREYADVAQHDLDHFVSMFDDLRAKAFLIGSPETVGAGIAELVDGGFDHIIFRVRWADLPVERAIETLERCAAEVLPKFR